MSQPMKFVFPMPPNITNSGKGRSRHWRTAHRERQEYLEICDVISMSNPRQIPNPPISPLPLATIESVMYLGGAMDDDNALARHKPILDWLKTRGYIVDDRRKNIRWLGLPDQIVKRDRNYRIELTLTEIAA